MTTAAEAEILRRLGRMEDVWILDQEANGIAPALTLNSPATARQRKRDLYFEMKRERADAEQPFETRGATA
jgi:hypothetical protein